MKKLKTLIIGLIFVNTLMAESYSETMLITIDGLEQAIKDESVEEILGFASKFERIAQKETSEWLPSYYAAYGYTIANYYVKSKKDKDLYIDKAELLIEDAEIRCVNPNHEIVMLKAYTLQARSNVNPPQRARKYAADVEALMKKVEDLNANNPRLYYMKGENYYYTPKMFGGGKDIAKPHFETALEKFAAFVPESEIHPNWGKERTGVLLKDCN